MLFYSVTVEYSGPSTERSGQFSQPGAVLSGCGGRILLAPLSERDGLAQCAAACDAGKLKGEQFAELVVPFLLGYGIQAAVRECRELLPDEFARMAAADPADSPARREIMDLAGPTLRLMDKHSRNFGVSLVPRTGGSRRAAPDILEFAGTVKHPVLFLVGFGGREAAHVSDWMAAKIHEDGVTPSRKLVTGLNDTLSMCDVADGFRLANGGALVLGSLSKLLGCRAEGDEAVDMSRWNAENAEALRCLIAEYPDTAAILCEHTGHKEFAARVQSDILKQFMQVRIENQKLT